MNTENILLCSQIDESQHELKFDNILYGTLRQKIEVFHKIEINLKNQLKILIE